MDEDIAVVGIGCSFPGGEGLDNFWKVLVEGKNYAVDIPEQRFDIKQWYDPNDTILGKIQTTKAAFIDGFNEFDHRFFGISEAEANFMDPQQKLLLHCSYRALEDSGIPMEKVSGSRTGVYIGLMNRDYETLLNNSPSTITHYNGTGTAMSIAANRISYTFNLTGPSFAIDSACSSSLVALHSACQAIRQGDCEMALCGGVSCILEPRVFVALSKAKMISPEGTSKPFCRRADGYGRGEGCGIVLLKTLKKALQDFDHIWGIVCKTAVNQDGHTVTPITKPSMVQQEELLKRIYSTGTYMMDVQYIEAHGTGTPVGDSVEAESISKVIAKARSSEVGPLLIGSVKSNIGHTESAAGVAGLIKVLLMMKYETIVPSVFYSEESSSIDVKALNVKIPTKAEKWHCNSSMERVAGINNFGFGGTNAHAIIREYKHGASSNLESFGSRKLFPLSAATSKSLELCIADTSQRISTDSKIDLRTLLYTSACRRSHIKHKYRKVYVTTSLSDLEEQLKTSLNIQFDAIKPDPKVVFVFCGNGVTYRGMCKQLLKEEPVFREKVREVENVFQNYRSTSILQKIASSFDNDDFSKPDIVQPLLFAIQVATAHLLKHWGIRPTAVLGHSVGEVAAAHCSGLLSLEEAVKVIYYRSVLQSKVTGGKMLVVGNVTVSDILKILPAYTGKVCLAALNSPQSCVLSGEKDAIESVHQMLNKSFKTKNVFLHVLEVPAAYHSQMMDPVLTQIRDSIGSLNRHEMECELFSTVTGRACCVGDFVTGDYWARNIRNPVAFQQAVRAVASTGKNIIFVEIGPRRALQRNIMETLGNDAVVLSSIQPDKDQDALLSVVSKLFELGVNVDWDQLYNGFQSTPASYPVYQFNCPKNDVYFEEVRQGNEVMALLRHPLIISHKENNRIFKCSLSIEATPYLWEHKSNGIAIAPGALYAELALASVIESLFPKIPLTSLQLTIKFQNLLVLSKSSYSLKVQLEPDEDKTLFQIRSSSTKHASGTIAYRNGPAVMDHQNIVLDAVLKRCPSVITEEQVYVTLNQAGFEYGPYFQQLGDIQYGEDFKEAVANIRIPDQLFTQLYNYCLHPVVLDYFFQLTAVLGLSNSTIRQGFPSAIGSMVITAPLCKEMVIYMRLTQEMAEYFEVCGCFTDRKGQTLIELKDVRITLVGDSAIVTDFYFFHNERLTVPEFTSIDRKPKAVVFEDTLGISNALKTYLHTSSVFISPTSLSSSQVPDFLLHLDHHTADMEKVVFICNCQNLSFLKTETVLEQLADICELYRHIVLTLKKCKHLRTLHAITYRSSESTVDHISPGFVLSGMTRACAAELSEITFQLIDLATVSSEDIKALGYVLCSYKSHEFPEVMISQGQVQSTEITRTALNKIAKGVNSLWSDCFVLLTANPYEMACLSAIPNNEEHDFNDRKNVEVQLGKICMHSSDYFPVSQSGLKFGQTLYWSKHKPQNHKLLALDFSGTVTAVGKDVRNLKVGDHIVACYPTVAASKVTIPEDACYKTKRIQFLKDIPCVSYIILAWEILHTASRIVKQKKTLCIFSTTPDSILMKVLTVTANKSGWNVFTEVELNGFSQCSDHCPVFVLIPPYDQACVAQLRSEASAKHIFLVCDNNVPPISILPNDNENMCFHFVQLYDIFQKSHLKTQNSVVNRWIKMIHLDSILSLQSKVFQPTQLESEGIGSYFTAKALSLIVLNNNGSMAERSQIYLHPRPMRLFSKTAVYIVSGGLSGLGLETVTFISHWGGKCIATLSRSAPSMETQLHINNLKKRYGARILPLQCDVSVPDEVLEAITVIGQNFPSCPIKGVFHSAAVLHDGLLETLNKSLFEKVMRPKVSGALNLHYATLNCKVDYFVCYSSISSFIGNASQANYAAANSFLDTLCHYRRNAGLAGQSINWGPLKLGLLFNKANFQKFLEAKGLMTMEVSEIHEALKHCLLENKPQQVVCKFNFRNLKNNVLSQNTSLKVRLAALIEKELEIKAVIESRKDPQSSFDDYIRDMVSGVCNVDADDCEPESCLASLGIDSMLAMTLQNQLFQDIGVNISLATLLDPNITLNSLATLLKESNDKE
ncbi:putative polyketide synthase 1 isoform X2 [Silurus meridionalis]|nr:putative polyketide synthase 1 isoform X2 [Silurus meridionalis]